MSIFVDTSAFYALLSHTDRHHQNAIERWYALLQDRESRLFTSNYIIVEAGALLCNRLGMKALNVFVREILPVVNVLWVDETTHFAATEVTLSSGKNGPSLVDCTSFTLMHEHGITEAFAFDEHFAKQGF